jgi:hypothetical protein
VLLLGKGVEFGGYVSGLGRTDSLEDLLRLPQAGLRIGGVTGVCRARIRTRV